MPRRGWIMVIILVAGTLTGCGLGVSDGYAPLRATDNFHVLEKEHAYRSAQLDASSLKLSIDKLGIRTVINLRGENLDEKWYQNEKATTEAAGVELIDIRMSAHELPPRAELLKLYDAFVTAEEPILIHCKAGADRTGAAAAIWRMMKLGDSREAASQELCVCFGHFKAYTPEMDQLVAMFQPDRTWIEQEYPVP